MTYESTRLIPTDHRSDVEERLLVLQTWFLAGIVVRRAYSGVRSDMVMETSNWRRATLMRLVDLQPRWVGSATEPDRPLQLEFLCPACAQKDEMYRHTLTVPVVNPADGGASLGPSAQWTRGGDDFASLTLSPSIHNQTGRWNDTEHEYLDTHWHGFIRNGVVTNA